MTSITLGKNVTSIGDFSFSGCDKLVEVFNYSSRTLALGSSYDGQICYNAKVLHTSEDEESIIKKKDDYLFITSDNTNYLIDYVGNETELSLPTDYNGEDYVIYRYAFSNCANLTSITIPDGVTRIGSDAFSGCTRLTSVTIPSSVTSIGSYAFSGCRLTSVTIPSSVTSIGYSAFNCKSLENVYIKDVESWLNISYEDDYSHPNKYGTLHILDAEGNEVTDVVIPDTITAIPSYAFYNCTSLNSIIIPDSVTSIGSQGFYNCTSLKSIIIPDSVTSIGTHAFSGCTRLTSVTIPSSVSSIGSSAFNHCTSLENVYIKDVTAWLNISFSDYSSHPNYYGTLHILDGDGNEVTEIAIPETVTEIPDYAFKNCTGLSSVIIPDSVTSIGYSAFENCTGLKDVYINDVDAWLSISCGSSYTRPNIYGTLHILDGDGNEVTEIAIPETITEIPAYAFKNFTILSSVIIPDSVTTIGSRAFDNCIGLSSVTIPASVTKIDAFVFYNCTELKDVYIKDVDAWLSMSCGNSYSSGPADTYTRPNYYGILHILGGNGNEVTEIVIPETVTKIPDYAFYNCTALTSITIPDSVTSIGSYAFYNCTSLGSVTIPANVTSIEHCVFYGCTNLSSVTIPDSVTTISNLVFMDTAYYKDKNNWENGVLYVGNHLIEAKNSILSGEYVIKDGTIVIADQAFSGCKSLTSVVIPDSVKTIGLWAFSYCYSLTNVTIPDSVTTIGSGVFYDTPYYKDENNWENGVLYVGNHLIEAKNSISGEYVIKDGTILIADGAFYDCKSLTSVVIAGTVTTIGSRAFYDCKSLAIINYLGTENEWSAITRGAYWNYYTDNCIINYSYVEE